MGWNQFRSWVIGLALAPLIVACSTNIYSFLENEDSESARLAAARVAINERDYSGARSIISKMQSAGQDSNDLHLLDVATKLGESGLDMWSILISVLESANLGLAESDTGNSSGVDTFFNSVSSSILGTGETKTARMEALRTSLQELFAAPQPEDSRVRGMSCLLAGVLSVPLASDMQSSLSATSTELASLKTKSDGGSDPCESLSALNSSVEQASVVTADFSLILQAASQGCAFLDSSKTSGLNSVETQVKKVTANADNGCSSLPECPSSNPNCNDIFPSCVQESIGVGQESGTTSGDGKVSGCELILYCRESGQCF